MKKFFATLMIMGTLAVLLPLDAFGQTYAYRRVFRNGRWQTVRVYTTRGRSYGWYNRNGVTPRERMRLMRQRSRIYNQQNRILRDGVITRREARRLNRSANRYQRAVRRARNY